MKGIPDLIARWEKDAKQYRAQIEEARKAGTPFDQMLATATTLEQCAKDLRKVAILDAVFTPL